MGYNFPNPITVMTTDACWSSSTTSTPWPQWSEKPSDRPRSPAPPKPPAARASVRGSREGTYRQGTRRDRVSVRRTGDTPVLPAFPLPRPYPRPIALPLGPAYITRTDGPHTAVTRSAVYRAPAGPRAEGSWRRRVVVGARSPDRATCADRRSPSLSGDLRSVAVARSGDRATTRGADRRSPSLSGDLRSVAVARSGDRATTRVPRLPEQAPASTAVLLFC